MQSPAFDFCTFSNALRETALEHDVRKIISMTYIECNHELDPAMFMTRCGSYKDSHTMYTDILSIITRLGHTNDLLEIMPYIDDFLSLYFT